eukprot:CAMPEP_0204827170 /NCGR_PEP_ID=MMETSP1346-20131115/4708_1 /ASSEMBLY_ACC=CAM_ASM_000771 /TAXON_ID=215587 /ORGANISM="Aplanochytrium stocchinoi, Strain GSBS06" /LENGTH=426 /DNA_ID=CAMNT_0051955509 /DNA_START=26 /DNA_END=1306 /DNA_ORIENTATION=-
MSKKDELQLLEPAGAFGRKMVAGGGAGAISRTLTAPMERVKVVLQTQAVSNIPESQRYKGIIDCLLGIPKQQGIIGYWRGNGLNVFRIIPNSAIKFSTFDYYKSVAFPQGESNYEGKEKFVRKMACGGLAGVSTLVPIYPLDLARTRLSADTTGRYRGLVHLVKSTVELQGVRGLYAGLAVSLCGIIPYLAISLATYDTLKELTHGNEIFDNAGGKVFLGSVAAIFSQSIAYPIDTIRRHMQVAGGLGQKSSYNTTFECIRAIYKANGWRGFYKGLVANASRAGPQTGIEFACFDIIGGFLVNQHYEKHHDEKFSDKAPKSNDSNETKEGDDGNIAKILVRRLSSLSNEDTFRINRIFNSLIKKSPDGIITRGILIEGLQELGYDGYEIRIVLEAIDVKETVDYVEFRQLCREKKIIDMLEDHFCD